MLSAFVAEFFKFNLRNFSFVSCGYIVMPQEIEKIHISDDDIRQIISTYVIVYYISLAYITTHHSTPISDEALLIYSFMITIFMFRLLGEIPHLEVYQKDTSKPDMNPLTAGDHIPVD